ncbi:Hypothetical protein PHPALM_10552 [Phytophthora palmivora]|uniref:Uncharacterized protein n=1 Tax=Phytophthora palmivora TaxID=4796 RepID=A0A2P4Y4H8_9STRA|nr:Hypothetical protein PHPALM_10552 [Phytophthora palmivora]
MATVLSKKAEEHIAFSKSFLKKAFLDQWKDGDPVSRAMLKLKGQAVAAELSPRTKTRQGKTTPADYVEAA